MVTIAFLLTVMLVSMGVTIVAIEKEKNFKKRLNTFVRNKESKKSADESDIKFNNLEKVKEKLLEHYSKKIDSKRQSNLQMKLLQAGSPFGMNEVEFYLFSSIFKISITIIFLVYGRVLGGGLFALIFLGGIGFLLGTLLPKFYLNLKIKSRYRIALREFPDFLDLLTISVEAGLGFDLALNRIISKHDGVISMEFYTCLEEIRLGKNRWDALQGIKERLNFIEMRSFINSVIQSEKLGMGIARALKNKADEERDKRKQRAEEAAMKVSIKILFPLIFFIFPSIFIVVLGPVVVQMIQSLGGV